MSACVSRSFAGQESTDRRRSSWRRRDGTANETPNVDVRVARDGVHSWLSGDCRKRTPQPLTPPRSYRPRVGNMLRGDIFASRQGHDSGGKRPSRGAALSFVYKLSCLSFFVLFMKWITTASKSSSSFVTRRKQVEIAVRFTGNRNFAPSSAELLYESKEAAPTGMST